MVNWMRWFPENVSTYGGGLDSTFALIYWVGVLWLVVTLGTLTLFLILYRRREGRAATYVAGERLREAAWLLIPCAVVLLMDLGIDWRGAAVWATVKGQSPPTALTIEVTGHQFFWEVVYPGPDGKFGTADDRRFTNEIHVPVHQPVRLILKSSDVIHSVFSPNLRLKQDVVPGRITGGWFEATKPGTYELPCAELCGVGHSVMNGALYVHTADEYQAWAKEQWPGARAN